MIFTVSTSAIVHAKQEWDSIAPALPEPPDESLHVAWNPDDP
jgi:hypothetical protein